MSPEDGRCLKVIDRAIRAHTGHRRRIHYTVLIRTALRLVANAPKLPSGKRILEAYESALALDQRRQPSLHFRDLEAIPLGKPKRTGEVFGRESKEGLSSGMGDGE